MITVRRFPAVPPGEYNVLVELEGFDPVEVTSLDVTVGSALSFDATLKLEVQTETITVQGSTAPIDTGSRSRTCRCWAGTSAISLV